MTIFLTIQEKCKQRNLKRKYADSRYWHIYARIFHTITIEEITRSIKIVLKVPETSPKMERTESEQSETFTFPAQEARSLNIWTCVYKWFHHKNREAEESSTHLNGNIETQFIAEVSPAQNRLQPFLQPCGQAVVERNEQNKSSVLIRLKASPPCLLMPQTGQHHQTSSRWHENAVHKNRTSHAWTLAHWNNTGNEKPLELAKSGGKLTHPRVIKRIHKVLFWHG